MPSSYCEICTSNNDGQPVYHEEKCVTSLERRIEALERKAEVVAVAIRKFALKIDKDE